MSGATKVARCLNRRTMRPDRQRHKKRKLTKLDLEMIKHGREMEVRAEEAWREWMFGKNIDKVVARK